MIAGYARRGDTNGAFEIFSRMASHGLVPDLVTWNAMISGFTLVSGNVSYWGQTESCNCHGIRRVEKESKRENWRRWELVKWKNKKNLKIEANFIRKPKQRAGAQTKANGQQATSKHKQNQVKQKATTAPN
ncbi:hypothetical protein QYF36_022216 [Acer negundo]|nr:hypothetical protein QYF36_022216 [Acer negundo]